MAATEVALDEIVQTFLAASLAESTKRTYRSQLKSYLSFCTLYGYCPVPATVSTILRYIAHLSKRLSYNYIKQYMSVVRGIHGDCYYPYKQVKMVLKGVRRLKGDGKNRKPPITMDILLALHGLIDHSSSVGASFWAACLLAFYGMLRKI